MSNIDTFYLSPRRTQELPKVEPKVTPRKRRGASKKTTTPSSTEPK